MFGDTSQTQATHSHSHTHAVHPSTYRAAAARQIAGYRSVTQGGEVQAGRSTGWRGEEGRGPNPLTRRPCTNAECSSAQMEEGQPDRRRCRRRRPPAGRHTFRRMSLAILKCGAALAARTKNYHRRSGDAEEQMEKSISSPPPPNYSVGSGLAENVAGTSETLRT